MPLRVIPENECARCFEMRKRRIGSCQMWFKRIQFTPDLLPADIIGTRIYNQQSAAFETVKGPVFTNFLLADEINRAPAKVQSALLETMQEKQVTIGQESHPVPLPFLVFATQNPIEQEGTYPLPEAQLDRFLLKVRMGYPEEEEEVSIVRGVTQRSRLRAVTLLAPYSSGWELTARSAPTRTRSRSSARILTCTARDTSSTTPRSPARAQCRTCASAPIRFILPT